MSWGEVQTLELPAAFELMSYWAKYPTVNMMLREYFNIKPPVVDEAEFGRAIASPEITGALGVPQAIPESMRDMVNWAEEQRTKMGRKAN